MKLSRKGRRWVKRLTITSPWWPLLALLLGLCLLCAIFLIGYQNNPSGFFDGLKAQDWATIASGIFAALAFAGLVVSVFYQRAEIDSLQKQVSETVQAMEEHATEIRQQTNALLQQVDCQRATLVGQQFADIDQYIEKTEDAIGDKLEELFRRLNISKTGVPAFEELLKKDRPAGWLAAVVRQQALREGQGPDVVPQFLEQRRVRVIFNTILSRCDLVSNSVDAMVQQAPHMKPRLTARLADSRINRIQGIIRYTRDALEHQPANAA